MDIRTSAETLQEVPRTGQRFAVRPYLYVPLECERPFAGSARHCLDGIDEVVIGRGSQRSCARERSGETRRLVVRIPSSWMSARHVRLFRSDGRWALEDVGSTNGTFVGGVRVERVILDDGATFDAGRTVFLFRAAVPTPEGTPLDEHVVPAADAQPPLVTLVPTGALRNRELARVAESMLTVLLTGESGTGKELAARAMHELSRRRGAFVAVNCGAISPALVEAQLFGHVKGAFSGAIRSEPGFVRAAEGGTLFLDEIGDLALSSQAALLRVLQEREVTPVGSAAAIAVDVRVVAATHRNLDELAAGGAFRADLLARLTGFEHALEPLRERREDLGIILATILLRLARGAAPAAPSIDLARALFAHSWPANVRELEQCLARAMTLTTTGVLDVEHLPAVVRASANTERAAPLSPADAAIRDRLVAELQRHGGNVAHVARAMGKARMQIHRWMTRFALDPSAFRRAP